ncbi:MAG: hypothetical protein NC253_00880 [Ruminococcus sp.]|nr:hypothetical protein [Ruminococcus sp.]MCM1380845.1 hypothetical protein [Muribaculaceae bacterium]MCM1478973.1 hypothetical protein [Muribaculaceae bacterium]
MNEKKEISAKDLYIWKKGMDDYGIKILSALNGIIDGFNVLQCCEWKDVTEKLELSSMCAVAERCEKIYNSDELMDMADNFEIIRSLLFGDKIDYKKLLEMLRDNVNECGWTEEKAEQRREENRGKLEEKRRKSQEKYNGKFSDEMPERIKQQREEFRKSE